VGNIVINQRVFVFDLEGGNRDTSIKVIGLFILDDGNIVEWKDFHLRRRQRRKKKKE